MVLWTRFVVILVLSYSTLAKIDSDVWSLKEVISKGFLEYCAKVPGCRYSKFLSVLKDNFYASNIGDSPSDELLDLSLKVKKYLGRDQTDVLDGNDSLEGETQPVDNEMKLEHFNGKKEIVAKPIEDLDLSKVDFSKRGHSSPVVGCDCRITNELIDLGHLYYPRYLLNAVCQMNDESFDYPPKCWRGAQCRPLEYKVRVLTHRSHNDHMHKDPTTSLLPEDLRSLWKFKTVTIAAGCFCS